MSKMVERVARALLIADDGGNADAILAATEHAGDCPFVAAPSAFTCSKCQADYYRVLARAAIVALREPIEAMLIAGKVKCHGVDLRDGWSTRTVCGQFLGQTAGDQWRAMIDAALG